MIWASLSELDEEVKVKPKNTTQHSGKSDWILAADVYQKGDNVVVKINLPGVEPEKLDIAVANDSVKISGSADEEEVIEGSDYFIKEIRRGSFERSIKLPVKVDIERADADYKKGILKITIPKKEESRVNKIKVKAGN